MSAYGYARTQSLLSEAWDVLDTCVTEFGGDGATAAFSNLPYDYLSEDVRWPDLYGDDPSAHDFAAPDSCAFASANDPILAPIAAIAHGLADTRAELDDGTDTVKVMRWEDGYYGREGVTFATGHEGAYAFDWARGAHMPERFTRSGTVGTLTDYVWLCSLLERAGGLLERAIAAAGDDVG